MLPRIPKIDNDDVLFHNFVEELKPISHDTSGFLILGEPSTFGIRFDDLQNAIDFSLQFERICIRLVSLQMRTHNILESQQSILSA
jgi:hypothetical protein